ncbi:MAG: DUF4105 domain-containing protein [Myxococcota bacterium]
MRSRATFGCGGLHGRQFTTRRPPDARGETRLIAALLTVGLAAPCTFSGVGGPPRVDLVTIAPGDDLFSSMGHTALVFSGGGLEAPVSFDWGAYDHTRSDLLPAFLTGELPYFLNVQDLSLLEARTRMQDRTAVAQRLDLDESAVRALFERTRVEAAPENRAYTYHWADANCATRARDALDTATGGALRTAMSGPTETTPRFEAGRHLWRWPVPAFAWRFITSRRLDVPLTEWERAMVPEHLMRSVGAVELGGRPFARDTCTLTEGAHGWAPSTPPASWPWGLPGLTGVLALGAAVGTGRMRLAGGLVALCGAILCAIGVPSLLLWCASDVEGIGPTENWLIAGPQSIALVWAGLVMARGRVPGRVTAGVAGLVGLVGLGVLACDAVGTGQANGDIVLALLPGLLASCTTVLWAHRH